MTSVVMDASVIIAAIKGEPGGEALYEQIEDALVSTVNLAEVYTFAERNALAADTLDVFLAETGIGVAALTRDQSAIAGAMVSTTRSAGLSLADRCCLALATDQEAVVLTADRAWVQFAGPLGLEIRLIR